MAFKTFQPKNCFPDEKEEVDGKYLIFTAVNHHVTVLFGQVFLSGFPGAGEVTKVPLLLRQYTIPH